MARLLVDLDNPVQELDDTESLMSGVVVSWSGLQSKAPQPILTSS